MDDPNMAKAHVSWQKQSDWIDAFHASHPTDGSTKVFVGGIQQKTTEAKFKEYFLQFGHVKSARIVKKRANGESRGYGFVTFKKMDAAQRATRYEKHVLDGKKVDVMFAFSEWRAYELKCRRQWGEWEANTHLGWPQRPPSPVAPRRFHLNYNAPGLLGEYRPAPTVAQVIGSPLFMSAPIKGQVPLNAVTNSTWGTMVSPPQYLRFPYNFNAPGENMSLGGGYSYHPLFHGGYNIRAGPLPHPPPPPPLTPPMTESMSQYPNCNQFVFQ